MNVKQQFDLQKHIEQGVEQIVTDTLRAAWRWRRRGCTCPPS